MLPHPPPPSSKSTTRAVPPLIVLHDRFELDPVYREQALDLARIALGVFGGLVTILHCKPDCKACLEGLTVADSKRRWNYELRDDAWSVGAG